MIVWCELNEKQMWSKLQSVTGAGGGRAGMDPVGSRVEGGAQAPPARSLPGRHGFGLKESVTAGRNVCLVTGEDRQVQNVL